jgi:hypothetical protein
MWKRRRKDRGDRFRDGQETSQDRVQGEHGPLAPEDQAGRFSRGQEVLSETPNHTRVGHFSDGQGRDQAVAEAAKRIQVDHGLPGMNFRTAFNRREEVTRRASDQGLIEAANRLVFHDRGFTLTWDTATGDLWLTPTENPEGWWYEEDVG